MSGAAASRPLVTTETNGDPGAGRTAITDLGCGSCHAAYRFTIGD